MLFIHRSGRANYFPLALEWKPVHVRQYKHGVAEITKYDNVIAPTCTGNVSGNTPTSSKMTAGCKTFDYTLASEMLLDGSYLASTSPTCPAYRKPSKKTYRIGNNHMRNHLVVATAELAQVHFFGPLHKRALKNAWATCSTQKEDVGSQDRHT